MPGVGLLSFAEPGLLVSRAKAYGHYPPGAVLVCGLAGIPLWLRSYACVPFRLAGRETDAEWGLVVASGVGAMVAARAADRGANYAEGVGARQRRVT
jgi:hypothetical protein